MEVKQITLHNIGRFSELTLDLAPLEDLKGNVTVLVGNNGSGKTSILKSLATSLSWLVARIQSERGVGTPIPELVIKNGKSSAAIELEVYNDRGDSFWEVLEDDSSEYPTNPRTNVSWSVTKARKGRKGEFKTDLLGATSLASYYRSLLTENEDASLPLIAFYSVERVVIEIPLKIRGKHSFRQLDGYDKSLSQGVDFRRFFEWYREREDTENESGLSEDVFEKIRAVLGDNEETWAKLKALKASTKDRQLNAVRSALYNFMPEFSNLRVKRKPRLHMAIDKGDMTLDVAQLSQGEKSLMALVGDIARRLAVMNPALDNPLMGDGVVLIDEVDMHLHPKWQRTLVQQLTTTFPNCQFVLTTHSPLVISDSKNTLTYMIDGDDIKKLPPLYGEDANTVLLEIMDTDVRNAQINIKLNNLLDAIHDADIDTANELLDGLEAELPASNMELAKARLILRKQALRHAKNP